MAVGIAVSILILCCCCLSRRRRKRRSSHLSRYLSTTTTAHPKIRVLNNTMVGGVELGGGIMKALSPKRKNDVERQPLSPKTKLAAAAEIEPAASALGRTRATIHNLQDIVLEGVDTGSKFATTTSGPMRALVFGHMADAAKGIEHFMCVSEAEVSRRLLKGLSSIHREFEDLLKRARKRRPLDTDALKVAEDSYECMKYILYEEAGSSPKIFPNSPYPRDCDADGVLPDRKLPNGRGMRLRDFVDCEASQQAGLTIEQVAALRIYTTAAFRSINDPLRDTARRERNEPHPLPLTCSLVDKAVGKLRAIGAYSEHASDAIDLWRGLRNVKVPDAFRTRGGTELAPMSTTNDLKVAIRYGATGDECILLKLRTRSSMERGADLTYLSAFPGEREFLFKPLTFLQPVGAPKKLTLAGRAIVVIDVEPRV